MRISATGLPGTNWTVAPALNQSTTYFWRIRAANDCATGPWSAIWGFTTGSCFIATAAFGTAQEARIDLLRSFRDRYLMAHPAGRAFVDLYYMSSPPVADRIAQRPWLRAVVRLLLTPVLGFVSLLG